MTPSPFRRLTALIEHPAWAAARDALLAMSYEPGAVALLGPPGTGKSALLRDVAHQLRAAGRVVTLVRQGDLVGDVPPGGVLLVDEACRMGPLERHAMMRQRSGFVVLADVDPPRGDPALHAVELRPLTDAETADFAAAWLAGNAPPGTTLSGSTIARLYLHSGGTVRLLLQLLGAAHAVRDGVGSSSVTGDDIDLAAAMREGWRMPADPAVTDDVEPAAAPVVLRPRSWQRGRTVRVAMAASALAACVALALGLRSAGNGPVAGPTSVMPPSQQAGAAIPPSAVAPTVELALGAPAPPLAGSPPVPIASVPAGPVGLAPHAVPAVVAPAPAALASSGPPPRLATLANPAQTATTVATLVPPLRPVRTGRRMGGAGMILVAQRGDTLERLYRDLYRDRAAPPYSIIVATNPAPIKPGAIVVFPEPPGGWGEVQR